MAFDNPKRLETQCTVYGIAKDGDDGMAHFATVYSDDVDGCVLIRVNGQWIRVNAKLLKLAVDHASETVPKW